MQSVKPPVEAPTSRQSRPSTSIPSSSRAFSSLIPPRETKRCFASRTNSASGSTSWLGRRATGPSVPTRTSPARTAPAAADRDGKRPRSARTASIRAFFMRRKLQPHPSIAAVYRFLTHPSELNWQSGIQGIPRNSAPRAGFRMRAGEKAHKNRFCVTALTDIPHIRSYAVQGFSRSNRRKRNTKLFGLVPRRTYGPRCFPHLAPTTQLGSPTSHGSTYIEIHISPPCSNPRSAPPPRRGVFCCASFSERSRRLGHAFLVEDPGSAGLHLNRDRGRDHVDRAFDLEDPHERGVDVDLLIADQAWQLGRLIAGLPEAVAKQRR